MSNLSGRGQLTGIMRSGSGGGGGSEVIINPSGAAIGTMEKISVDGDVYEVRNVPDATSASNGDVLTRSASGVGWYPPTKELPVFTSGDNSKVLAIINDTLTWIEIPKELPTISSSDEGKVLGVSNGAPVWTSSGGGGGVIYSTDEQEIGTWIDGSKVYSRTIYIPNPTMNARTNIDLVINAALMIDISGTVIRSVSGVGDLTYTINTHEDSNYYTYCVFDNYIGKIAYYVHFTNSTTKDLCITIRYTKGE